MAGYDFLVTIRLGVNAESQEKATEDMKKKVQKVVDLLGEFMPTGEVKVEEVGIHSLAGN